MKSIIEEASSVIKAIEKGWIQAGKPNEFSVKIFEVEQKNFLGITTRSAKIVIFYGDKVIGEKLAFKADADEKKGLPAKKEHKKPVASRDQLQNKLTKLEEKKGQVAREAWTTDMTVEAYNWLKKTLHLMNMPDKNFTTEVKNYYLKINFEQPLLENSERERLLFRSLAHLLMQSLRNKFKKGFRGFKVILNSQK